MQEIILPYFINPKIFAKNYKLSPSRRDLINIFSRPIFTIIFRPKFLDLDADSILRVKIMVEYNSHILC